MTARNQPDFSTEFSYADALSIGVDEVGRGCIAGPVVAAAAVFPKAILSEAAHRSDLFATKAKKPNLKTIQATLLPSSEEADPNVNLWGRPWWSWLDDSKKLSPEMRAVLAQFVERFCRVGIGLADESEIDRLNILRASMVAMRRAVERVVRQLDQTDENVCLLVDGHMDPTNSRFGQEDLEWRAQLKTTRVQTLVKGDSRSLSIAAASVVAKVYRDHWMVRLDSTYPGYGFANHKGYLAPAHIDALKTLGPCTIHRKTFAPVSEWFAQSKRHADCLTTVNETTSLVSVSSQRLPS